ncbi:MAG: anhydro-N-acetylmuramic acid kinase [Pseudomonadales bacterium]|nr:anhydro-N-acetylmuramic acid kinase [Pseudomonadales bacterium]
MTGALFLGAISGTSVDGLDLALVDMSGHPRVVAGATHPLPPALRTQLLALGQPGGIDLDELGRADVALGRFIGDAALEFLLTTGVAPRDVTGFGSHGQTVRHRPDGALPFTLQIGDPNQIAERTGITVVADFRRRDMAAGGQGAPLVPLFHRVLFGSRNESRAVLNIGGIANLTLLPADQDELVRGFDTGPGNGLMDAWTARHRGQAFDADGAWSRSGTVDQVLLDRLCSDPFFAVAPPKSTGREYFNLPWLTRSLPATPPPEPARVQATLRALTAQTIAHALVRWGGPVDRVIVCGGGRHNGALMDNLRGLIDRPVETAEDHGADGDSVEAAAFAWLASRALDGTPGNDPAVTGAAGPRVLGGVYRA